jgi:putative flippase GtrA
VRNRSKVVLVRTGLSGVFATSIDVMMLILLVEVAHLPVAVAAFLGAASGASANYLVNKYWAFQDKSPIRVSQLLTFAFVALCTALFMAGAMQLFAVEIGLPYLVAKAVAAVAVFCLWSYPAQARLVFRQVAADVRQSLEIEIPAEVVD